MSKQVKKLHSSKNKFTGIDIFFLIILGIGALLIIVPFWNVLVVSFATQKEYADTPLMLFPKNPTLESYQYLFRDGKIWQGYKNTALLELLGLPLSMFLTITMSYALSKRNFPGRQAIIYLVTFTMIFNGGIVPMYLVMKQLHLTGTMWSVVFSNCFSVFNMILMINYFQSLPESLMESARLDGAGEWRILWNIVLPLAKPIIATVTLFYCVSLWNQWYDSMIFLRKANMMPLQNVLRSIIQETEINTSATGSIAAIGQAQFADGIKMAAVFLTMVPIMCIFPLLQKHFAKGVMIGAIK
ncbi:MAG: carbohydrate ABC transporter permease [Oscillospiraceae bacterium]